MLNQQKPSWAIFRFAEMYVAYTSKEAARASWPALKPPFHLLHFLKQAYCLVLLVYTQLAVQVLDMPLYCIGR